MIYQLDTLEYFDILLMNYNLHRISLDLKKKLIAFAIFLQYIFFTQKNTIEKYKFAY